MQLKIEPGVPLPTRGPRSLESVSKTISQMKVGDSFALGNLSAGNNYTIAKCWNMVVTMRTVKEKREVRVWRIA